MLSAVTSYMYSKLGSNSSLLPLAIKDVANSVGITAGSYVTGKDVESKDRFIDEFGTQAIWLGGIPFYKGIANVSLYKLAGIDPKFDPRNINYINKLKKGTAKEKKQAEEFAKLLLEKTPENLKKSVENALSKPNLVKNLSLIKFGVSTALAIATYMGLTKYRQHYRLEEEKKQLSALDEFKKGEQERAELHKTPQAFQGVHNKKGISFTGGLQDFMFNPVKNLMLLDGAITEERLRSSESKQEFINYSIKEGGTWAFMYFAGPIFQKFFERKAMEKHNIPINFDSRIIESADLEKSLKNGSLKNSITEFEKLGEKPSDLAIYKFIHENPNNILVQMAKKADIISTLDEKGTIDTRAFFDIQDFKDLKDRMNKLSDASTDKDIDKFIKTVRKLKRGSIIKNMGICIAALGVGVPLLMIASRYLIPNNREYKVKEAAAQQLAQQKTLANA